MSGRAKMKILYFCSDPGIPFWGVKGSSIHLREFVRALRNEGYDFSVVAKLGDRDVSSDNAFSFHDLPHTQENHLFDLAQELGEDKKLVAELKAFYQNPFVGKLLTDLHERGNFELIYERYSLFGIAGLKFARASGIPHVLEVNAPLVTETSKYRRLVLAELARAIEKHLFSDSDHIIAVSDELRKYILEIQPKARVSVIPNGVSVERFDRPSKQRESASRWPDFSGSKFVIGFVGNLRPWHGIEILIDSFARLARQDADSRLLIIGDQGRLKAGLEKRCLDHGLNERVIFTGAIPHEEVPALMLRTDVLVAPYPEMPNFYFSSLKIFEYMAAGKAIVASRIGQIAEILSHEKTGLLVPPGDKDALHDALLRLKANPELRQRLGENAKADAFENHTWKKRFGLIEKIFQTLANSQPLLQGR